MLIRKLRSERKMSQLELAARAGVSFSFVNQVEGGKQTVRLDALNKLLSVFGYAMIPQAIQTPKFVEAPKVIEALDSQIKEEELPPVTIHRPKNDWSFFD